MISKGLGFLAYKGMTTLLNMSIMAGVVILGVILVRYLLRKAPKIFSYALWSIVLFRLLCPVSISTPFSILNVADFTIHGEEENREQETADVYEVPHMSKQDPVMTLPEVTYPAYPKPEVEEPGIQQDPTYDMPETFYSPGALKLPVAGAQIETEEQPVSQPEITRNRLIDMLPVVTVIWLAGIAVLLAINIISLIRVKRKVAISWNIGDNIYLADQIDMPFCVGVFCPRIYLPSSVAEEERDYIILHEQHHIRRGDNIMKMIAFGALCLHWFNPLVWVAFVLAGKDMEMSCDEAVIKRMGMETRSAYAMTLLKLATGRKSLQISTLSFGEGNPKERIKNVMNYKKATVIGICSAAILCVVIGVILGTNAAQPRDTENVATGENNEKTFDSETEEASQSSQQNGEDSKEDKPGTEDNQGIIHNGGSLTQQEIFQKYYTFVDQVKEINQYRLDHEGFFPDTYLDEMGNPLFSCDALETEFQNPGYRIMDVNEDGVFELVFGETDILDSGNYDSYLYDMYTIYNGEIVHVFSGGTRTRYFLTLDGKIGCEWSSSLEEYGCDFYEFDGLFMTLTEAPSSYTRKVLYFTPFFREYTIIYDSIDEDPKAEYVVFSGEDGVFNIIDFYFNGELIYHHEDLLPVDLYSERTAYVDLDHDGEKEIFLAMLPHVNSMPLMEYAVLKKIGDEWVKLEMYQGDTMLDNTFPLHVVREKDKYTAAVYCEGLLNNTISFSLESVYTYWKLYTLQDPYLGQVILDYFDQEIFKKGVGAEIGHTSAWGIWEIYTDTYKGQPCLVAQQGIQGYSKEDFWGNVYIYFDYDQKGRIRPLHLEFEPFDYAKALEALKVENGMDSVRLVSAVPSKEEVLKARAIALAGMSDSEIERLRENIKVANLQMKRAYINDNLFGELENKDSLYWQYFDQIGEFQIGWWYKGDIRSKEQIMGYEKIDEEAFEGNYEVAMEYNRFDANNFIVLIDDMRKTVTNEALRSDLQRLIDLTEAAAQTHEMEYANEVYKLLHDLDYFLLRYGIEDVGQYVKDDSVVAKYYGTLSIYH